MNAIFCIVFLSATAVLCFIDANAYTSVLTDGVKGAIETCVTLACVYSVWMGLSSVAEKSGLTKKTARLLQPACKKFFKTDDEDASKDISMNVCCNLLGLGGAATPFAVSAIERLNDNGYAQKLLFIVNATSIQLIPTTVITLRASFGSASPNDIILPSLITTFLSTLLAVVAYCAYEKWRT